MKFRIENTNVYGLDFAIKASGNPMRTKIDRGDVTDSDWSRIKKLGTSKSGHGHDCALKGITVTFDITAPEMFYRQLDRYHFIDYISSQSKMHRLLKMNISDSVTSRVNKEHIKYLENLVSDYNEQEVKDKELWRTIVDNVPISFHLTASMTTNYLQLKTIYQQRKGHKLEEWHEFIKWCDGLPHFKELALKERTV